MLGGPLDHLRGVQWAAGAEATRGPTERAISTICEGVQCTIRSLVVTYYLRTESNDKSLPYSRRQPHASTRVVVV